MEISEASRLLLRLSVIGLLGLVVALAITPVEPLPPLPPGSPVDMRDVNLTVPQFQDRTLDRGLVFTHRQGEEQLMGLDEALGPGACVLDYNNDGWLDLFLVNGSGQTRYYGKPYWFQALSGNALFQNIGGERFEDRTVDSGLKSVVWGMGCTSADFDNDGDADLLVTAREGDRLYRNNGHGGFEDVTAGSGLYGGWSTTATLADFDGDGLTDLYTTGYVDFRKGAHTYEADTPYQGKSVETFQPELYKPLPNHLYRNLGGLKFQDVTDEAGVANREGRSLGAVWFDANDDRRPDLMVSNDRGGSSNVLFLNQDGKHFVAAGLDYGFNASGGFRGIALGDMDGNGMPDVVVASLREHLPLVLLRQTGTGTTLFSDRARELGIGSESLSGLSGWTPLVQDFNLDGRPDLFMAQGLLTPDPDAPRVSEGQPKSLWLARDGASFEDVSARSGVALQDTQSARGAVHADFDNDGDADIYVAHNNDPGQLLVNEIPSGSHWMGIRLVGTSVNRDAIGSIVRLKTSRGEQMRVVNAGSGFASGSDKRLSFGLGAVDHLEWLRVEWPDGKTEEYRNLPVDHYLTVIQGQGRALREETRAATVTLPEFAAAEPADRRRYLRLLVQAVGLEAAMPQLRLAMEAKEARTRLTVMKLATRHKHSESLALLSDGMGDRDASVAMQALQGLCGYEDESSIRWLLRAFRHPDAGVRKKLAGCFAFFFQEEEAVIHRKYLAIPYLIQLLDDSDAEVVIEAMRALGNAERYRAVDPLLNVLARSQGRIQAEAARALGLIRERKADASLLKILADPVTSPVSRSQALIALKRLDHAGFDSLLEELVMGQGSFTGLSPQVRLEMLEALVTDLDDGVVISRPELAGHLLKWGGEQHVRKLDGPVSERLARVLGSINLPSVRPVLEELARNPAPGTRLAALLALMQTDRGDSRQWVERGLSDADPGVRLGLLGSWTRTAATIAVPASLILKTVREPATRLAALQALPFMGDTSSLPAGFMRSLLYDDSQSQGVHLAVLEAISKTRPGKGKIDIDIPEHFFRSASAPVRILALQAWAAMNPPDLLVADLPEPLRVALSDSDPGVQLAAAHELAGRPEAWARRKAGQLLSDSQSPAKMRLEILRSYRASGPEILRQALLDMVARRDDPLRYRAIRKLAKLADGSLVPLAWAWLRDPSEPLKVRIKAARILLPVAGSGVLDILKAGAGNSQPVTERK